MKLFTWMLTLALSVGLSSYAFGQLTGKVTFEGEPPEMAEIDMSGVRECAALHADPVEEQTIVVDENGGLANVVVAIRLEDGQDVPLEVPTEPAVLDQEGCMYTPRVVAMMTGQPLIVKNSDAFLHNVHAITMVNPAFNFAQPNKDPGRRIESPKAEETFRVKCDVHPWMTAYIAAFEHPYFAVTKEDGTYEIKNLPDGEYTVIFWHEKLATEPIEERVEIKDGKATLDYSFSEAGALGPSNAGAAQLASSEKTVTSCCSVNLKAAE